MSQHRHIIWNMTRKCNFRCHYCYFPHDNTPVTETLPVTSILEFLERMGGEWLVGMTGGEPFIYPDFVNICRSLTEKHKIGVDTNLSVSSRVRDFARAISPERVHDIYASLHIEERERMKGVDAFITNYHELHSRGFNIIVNYVVHPTLAERFPADRDFFAQQGVTITPRPFKGKYEGRRYPEAYSQTIKDIFAQYPESGHKMVFNFKGVPCHGGHTFFRMEPDGTVFRCPGDKTVVGNIKDGINTTDGPTPCRMHRCPCQGVHYVEMNGAQQAFVEGMRLYNTGDAEKAKEAFAQAAQLDTSMSSAVNNLGVLAMHENRFDEAAKLFAQANSQHPAPLFLSNTILALKASGDTDAAEMLCTSEAPQQRSASSQPAPSAVSPVSAVSADNSTISTPDSAPDALSGNASCETERINACTGKTTTPEMSDVVNPATAYDAD